MSDTSSAAFTELKDDGGASGKKEVSIPIQAGPTSTSAKPPPPPSAAAADATAAYSSLFQSTTLPPYTFDWFMFYLKQTRVLVILAHLILFFVLVVWVASLGKAPAIGAQVAGGDCTEWTRPEIIPDVISVCPPAVAQIFYPSVNSRVDMGATVTAEAAAQQPSAIFVPGATSSGYYTAIFLHPDSPTRSEPINRNSLKGIITNMQLTQKIDTMDGEWIVPYSAPSPNTNTGEHRYVWLIYRHSSRVTDVAIPSNLYRFDPEKWIADSWTQKPQLVAGQRTHSHTHKCTQHPHSTHTSASRTTAAPARRLYTIVLIAASPPCVSCARRSQLLHLSRLSTPYDPQLRLHCAFPSSPALSRLVSLPHTLLLLLRPPSLILLPALWSSLSSFPRVVVLRFFYPIVCCDSVAGVGVGVVHELNWLWFDCVEMSCLMLCVLCMKEPMG